MNLEVLMDTIKIDKHYIHIIIDIYKTVGITISNNPKHIPLCFTDVFKASHGID